MPRVRFNAPSADPRPEKAGTVYGAGHETDYDTDDYEYIKSLILEGKAELLDGAPEALWAAPPVTEEPAPKAP
jgi:hypothetical protein